MFNTGSENIENVSKEFVAEIKNIFSDKLRKVILYGSYARGDYDDESDIDVMVLVDMPDEEIEKKWDKVLDLICETDNKYNVYMSPLVKDINFYNKWRNHMPFFKNIDNDGVIWYG